MDPIISGIGGLAGAGASFIGGILQNQSNKTSSMYANQANYMMQLQNQQWQEHMSSTAYQRGVADMKAAGLNPAMMFGGSGGAASSPSGGASHANAAVTQDAVSPAIEKILTALRINNETSLNKAMVDKVTQETATSAQQANVLQAEATGKNIVNGLVAAETAARTRQHIGSAKASEAAAAATTAGLPGVRADSALKTMKTGDYEKAGTSETAINAARVGITAAKTAAEGARLVSEVNSARALNEANMWLLRRDSGSGARFKPNFIPPSKWN